MQVYVIRTWAMVPAFWDVTVEASSEEEAWLLAQNQAVGVKTESRTVLHSDLGDLTQMEFHFDQVDELTLFSVALVDLKDAA